MAFSDPRFVLDQCGLSEGRTVVDCGCGDGAYAFEMSKLVGDTGVVYAIDIQENVLVRLKNTADGKGIKNVHVIHSDIDEQDGTKLGNESADLVILANVFFQLENKETMAAEAYRIVKPQGRVLCVDWTDSFNGLGPEKHILITKVSMQNYFAKSDFTLERELNAGDHHYGLIFRKP